LNHSSLFQDAREGKLLTFIVVALIVVIYLGAGFYFATQIIYPHKLSHQQTYQIEKEAGRLAEDQWNAYPKEEVWIDSPYGYKLYGLFVPYPGSHKTIILVHGITYTLFGAVKYIPLFYPRGFNVMLYDQRYHGRSGGKNCTFGYHEKYDLRAVTDWVYKRMGGGGIVGVHGESLGAAVVLQSAAVDERLAFVIADCPFSDLKKELTIRIHQDYHLPSGLFLPLVDFFCTILSGMSFDTVSPLCDMREVTTPILFIHGKNDDYIPPEMSSEMYRAKNKGVREIFLAPEAGHAESFWTNKAEYNQVVGQFFTRIGMDQ
jgi:uncharacterized protein